jgi:serine/threonine-protein kinase
VTAGSRQQIGRYELLGELGRGGMAELHVARLVGAGGFVKLFAIKRILPQLAHDARFVAMFMDEAKIAAGLSHPNICQVFELAQVDDQLILVMELLDGAAWSELIALGRGVDLRLTAGVLAQAADGLHHGHERGVVHRDVSPQNLFLTTSGVCKVLDFGVAKVRTERSETGTGTVKGKLPYMAPEQIRGEPLDARADVFALGAVVWESLTGRRLFDRETDYLIAKAICDEPIPNVTSVQPGLPRTLDDVLRRALERDRAARFATARDLAAALVQVGGMMLPSEIAAVLRDVWPPRARAELLARTTSQARAAEPADRSAASTIGESPEAMRLRRRAAPVARRKPRRWPAAVAAVVIVAAATAAIALHARDGEPAATTATPSTSATTPAPAPMAKSKPATGHPRPRPRAVATTPTTPPPSVVPPGVFDPARTRQLDRLVQLGIAIRDETQPMGTLSIDSAQPATIYVDGQRVGDTPIRRHPVPAGQHHVHAVTADGHEQNTDVDIVAASDTTAPRLEW